MWGPSACRTSLKSQQGNLKRLSNLLSLFWVDSVDRRNFLGNIFVKIESFSVEVSMDDGTRAPRVNELVEQFAELLYRYAYRLTGNAADAEDLTQQTFLRAQQKSHQLRDASAARWWLCSIMRNTFLSGRRNPEMTVSLEMVDESAFVDEPPDSFVEPEELQQVLLELGEEFRSPLILFYFEEFSYQEIADQMGVPIGTVMSRLSRAKAFLRRRLSEKIRPGKTDNCREKVAGAYMNCSDVEPFLDQLVRSSAGGNRLSIRSPCANIWRPVLPARLHAAGRLAGDGTDN